MFNPTPEEAAANRKLLRGCGLLLDVAAAVVVVLVLALTARGGSVPSWLDTDTARLARVMCDTNAGGYHLDQECVDRYLGAHD